MKKFVVALLILTLGAIHAQAEEIALPEMGDSAGALISPLEEQQIGKAFFWRLQQSVDLLDDPEVVSYVQNLGYRLVSNSDAPWLKFTFFVVPQSSINAFAAPGGYVGVHSGLLIASDTEAELASVMSHEIAHITQRHLLRAFEKQKQMSLPMTVGMIAAALLGAQDMQMGSAALMALQAGGVQSQINFTRSNEREADNLGMQTLVRSGFDPMAMPSFFEKLQQTSRLYGGAAVPEFLRTHPVTLSRIADAKGRALQYKLKPHLSDQLQFYLMREKLRVLTSTNLSELIQQYAQMLKTGNTQNVSAARYGYSLALLAAGSATAAREQLQPLIDADPDRLSYQLALADIEMDVGRVKAALRIYDESQKLYPDDQALSLKQVTALIQVGQPDKAAAILQRLLDQNEPSRNLFKLLAQAKQDMGQKSESHQWLAEYYYLSGLLRAAADQLRLAAKFAKGNEYERAKIASRLRQVEADISELERS
jgi:predicted Zn-dependent protease